MANTVTRFSMTNMGGGSAGLVGTVGYALYNASDGSVYQARTTSGIYEMDTGNSGVYGVAISIDTKADVFVLWDNGSGIYAVDTAFSTTDAIKDQTDKIKLIQQTIKNSADFDAEMRLKIAGMENMLMDNTGKPEMFESVLKDSGMPAIPDKITGLEKILAAMSLQQSEGKFTPEMMDTFTQSIAPHLLGIKSDLAKLDNKVQPGKIHALEKRLQKLEKHIEQNVGNIEHKLGSLTEFLSNGFTQLDSLGKLSIQRINQVEDVAESKQALADTANVLSDVKKTIGLFQEINQRIFALANEMKMTMNETRKNNIGQLVPYLSVLPGRKK